MGIPTSVIERQTNYRLQRLIEEDWEFYRSVEALDYAVKSFSDAGVYRKVYRKPTKVAE